MGDTLANLDPRLIARLRTELCEVIAANLAYPSYYDFRSERVRVRPLGTTRRTEIARYIGGLDFGPAALLEPGSAAMREFLEQSLRRFAELGGDAGRSGARRRVGDLRAAVRAGAASAQRDLVAAAAGGPNRLGEPRPLITWGDASGQPSARPDKRGDGTRGGHAEDDGRALQGALVGSASVVGKDADMHANGAFAESASGRHTRGRAARVAAAATTASVTTASATTASAANGGAANGGGATVKPALADATEKTMVIAAAGRAGGAGSRPRADEDASPFAGLELGSQSAIFEVPDDISERATAGPAAIRRITGQPTEVRPIPPPPPQFARLYDQLVGGHGSDSIESRPTAGPVALDKVGSGIAAMAPTAGADGHSPFSGLSAPGRPDASNGHVPNLTGERTDAMVFGQLRNQIETYIRMAAQSYGVVSPAGDPALTLDALRQSGHVEEADLRMAEGILAISDRVGASGAASLDDYRQALMLYLLYHRGKVGV